MLVKIIVTFTVLLAVARAGVVAPAFGYAAAAPAVAYATPIAKVAAAPVAVKVNTEYDPNPQYTFAYAVSDALTGDNKNQHETRTGDVVQGSYSLVEPDGTIRTVNYIADPINGFNAVVNRGPAIVKAPAVVAPVVAKAPVAYAPAAYAPAPVAFAPGAAPFSYAPPFGKAIFG